jgi:hypothetical protein
MVLQGSARRQSLMSWSGRRILSSEHSPLEPRQILSSKHSPAPRQS